MFAAHFKNCAVNKDQIKKSDIENNSKPHYITRNWFSNQSKIYLPMETVLNTFFDCTLNAIYIGREIPKSTHKIILRRQERVFSCRELVKFLFVT